VTGRGTSAPQPRSSAWKNPSPATKINPGRSGQEWPLALVAGDAPNIRDIIVGRQVLTPLDIERTIGLTEGNIFQGELSLEQLFFNRPVPGYARFRTPIRDLWLCGSSTHPGGGIMGANGRIAAMELLRARGRKVA
jgi:phytoene dehydrogenase-like protein